MFRARPCPCLSFANRLPGLALLIAAMAVQAQVDESAWDARFQATYVRQHKPAFASPYSGPNSLQGSREYSYSFTTTAALGWRPWAGDEFYFNPEAAQGVALSNLTGLGGFTNGELARTSGSQMKVYRARLFWRHTTGLGGGRETIEADANQLADTVDRDRLVWTLGNFSALDLFDDNRYAHDPRTQFMNWSLMTHGAWDYPADSRGYSWGLAAEWHVNGWVLRAARFIQPKEPNGLPLDRQAGRHYGDQIEIERPHALAGQPGKVRLLVFRNRSRMAAYSDAQAQAGSGVPDLNAARTGERLKYGGGVNVEQALSSSVGVFARAAWADGRTETYAFTEIDRSASAGLSAQGTQWGRPDDVVGLAAAVNSLSAAHRRYLATGGIAYFLGDGALRYGPEQIAEAFYAWTPHRLLTVTLDAQYIRNPGYNRDRGPARVFGLRLHTEF